MWDVQLLYKKELQKCDRKRTEVQQVAGEGEIMQTFKCTAVM